MRLIDADAMNEELFYKQVGGKDSLITAESAFEMINAQPTAYDVDAVVKQLEYELFRWKDSGEAYNDEKEKGVAIGFQKAIEIVKGGGVDDNSN